MTLVSTEISVMSNTRESARRIRVEPVGFLDATNVQQALEEFASSLPSGTSIRVVTAAGDVTITTSDVFVGINKTVGAATTVNLPASAGWLGADGTFPLIIKDLKGDANTNNISIVPNGAETIDGIASYPIMMDFGAIRLRPLPTGGWYVV